MAKYISTKIVNAAQWDPQDTEPMREFLAPLKSKIKKISLAQEVKLSKLDTVGALSVDTLSLIIELNSTKTVITAKPTYYVVQSDSGLKAMSASSFEEEYKLDTSEEEDPGEEEGDLPNLVNKTALTTGITAAESIISSTTVSEDGSDVESTKQWVPQSAVDALTAAIATAQAVADDEAATQTEVDDALTSLEEAITTFNGSFSAGTKTDNPVTPSAVNKTALNTLLSATENMLTDANISVDGSDVDSTEQWVTQADIDTFIEAVNVADAVANDADATQEEVDSAVESLNEAIAAFGSAKQNGTKQGQEPNKSALITAINDAVSAKTDVAVSTNGYDVAIGTQWVTSDDMHALDEVLGVAEETRDDVDATQGLIDSAAEDLAAAIAVFNAAKKNGMYTDIAEGEVDIDWDD